MRRRRRRAIAGRPAVRVGGTLASTRAVIGRVARRRRSAKTRRSWRTIAVAKAGIVRAIERLIGKASAVDARLAIRIAHACSLVARHECIAVGPSRRAAFTRGAMVLGGHRLCGVRRGVARIGSHASSRRAAVKAWNLPRRNGGFCSTIRAGTRYVTVENGGLSSTIRAGMRYATVETWPRHRLSLTGRHTAAARGGQDCRRDTDINVPRAHRFSPSSKCTVCRTEYFAEFLPGGCATSCQA